MHIVKIGERPDLAPVVAGWLWNAFWRDNGYALEDVSAFLAGAGAASGPPQCFLALVDGQPAGTASFTAEDLDERPDLTPWLANVFVSPTYRGRGIARHLVAAVEAACADPVLWLYTTRAEGLYRKIGWDLVDIIPREGRLPAILMRRQLHAV